MTNLNRGSMKGNVMALKAQYTSMIYKWYVYNRSQGYARFESLYYAFSNANCTFHDISLPDPQMPRLWSGQSAHDRAMFEIHSKYGF